MYNIQREKNISIISDILVALGLIAALGHLVLSFYHSMLDVIYYGKINISSVAFLVSQLMYMYLPVLLVSDTGRSAKGKQLKWIFYLLSVCYLLGNVWIIEFFVENGSFSAAEAAYYSYQRSHAHLFNYMTWNCYTPANLIFSLISAVLCFVAANSADKSESVFKAAIMLQLICLIAVPLVFSAISAGNDRLWITTNYTILISQICTIMALFLMASSQQIWARRLWSVSRRD